MKIFERTSILVFCEYYLPAAVQLPCREFKDTRAALIAVLIIDCWQNCCCASRHIKVSLWYYQVPATNQKLFGIVEKVRYQKWWRAKIERITNNLIKNKPHRCALLHIIIRIKSIMLEAFENDQLKCYCSNWVGLVNSNIIIIPKFYSTII